MKFEKDKLIPTIESKAFAESHQSRFALGKVAVDGVIVPGREAEYDGIARLRASTYLESGFITIDDLGDDGTELDKNDLRSVHFAILERTAVSSLARVVGNMRLVIKSDESPTPLPLEEYRMDYFKDKPMPVGGVEVSRLIAMHEDANIQNSLKWPLFVAGYKYVEDNELGPVCGLMTPALTRLLRMQKIPVSAMTDAKYIDEINTSKQPVSINLKTLKRLIDIVGDNDIDISKKDFSYIDINELKH